MQISFAATSTSNSAHSLPKTNTAAKSVVAEELQGPYVLERPNCQLHYWVGGPQDGSPLLLIHGGGLDHHQFDNQIDLLSHKFCILAPDLRGHGLSASQALITLENALDDLLALLTAREIQKVRILGVALGGVLAQLLYYRNPEYVTQLVLISCPPIDRVFPLKYQVSSKLGRLLLRFVPFWIIRAHTAIRMGNLGSVQRYADQTLAHSGKRQLLAAWDQLFRAHLDLQGLELPAQTIVLYGSYDRILPPHSIERSWAQRHPSIRRIPVPGAGHSVPQENPLFVNALLEEFLL